MLGKPSKLVCPHCSKCLFCKNYLQKYKQHQRDKERGDEIRKKHQKIAEKNAMLEDENKFLAREVASLEEENKLLKKKCRESQGWLAQEEEDSPDEKQPAGKRKRKT